MELTQSPEIAEQPDAALAIEGIALTDLDLEYVGGGTLVNSY